MGRVLTCYERGQRSFFFTSPLLVGLTTTQANFQRGTVGMRAGGIGLLLLEATRYMLKALIYTGQPLLRWIEAFSKVREYYLTGLQASLGKYPNASRQ